MASSSIAFNVIRVALILLCLLYDVLQDCMHISLELQLVHDQQLARMSSSSCFCWKQSYLTPQALNKVGFLSLIQRRKNVGVRLKATLRAPAIWGWENRRLYREGGSQTISQLQTGGQGVRNESWQGGGCNEEKEEGEEEQKGEDDEFAPINKKCIHKDKNNEDMLLPAAAVPMMVVIVTMPDADDDDDDDDDDHGPWEWSPTKTASNEARQGS